MAQRGGSTFTVENANFFRYSSMLLDLGAEVLRNVFQIYLRQTTLKQFLLNNKPKLDTLLNKNILSQNQYDLLFPQHGDPDLNTFDITLLFCLLRNLNANVRPWDPKWTNPSAQDFSLEADIGRIRKTRNRLHGHVSSTFMSVVAFNKEKIELGAAYLRLLQNVPLSPAVTLTAADVTQQIKKLSQETLEPARQEILLHSLNAWYAADIPHEMAQIREKISEHSEGVKYAVKSLVTPLKKEVVDLKSDLQKLSYGIESDMESMVDQKVMKRRIYDSKIEIQDFIVAHKDTHLELAAVTEAKKTLAKHNRLILSGRPGTGKSHMAMVLLNGLLQDGHVSVIILREADEWERLVNPDMYMCIYIDDFLGKFTIDVKEKSSWQYLVPAIKAYNKSGKTQLIVTIRSSILEEVESTNSESKIVELFGPSIFDLSAKKNALKIEEKEAMVAKYARALNIDKQEITSICKGKEIIGFPQCCKMLTDCSSKTLALSIFQHPLEYVVKEVENLFSVDPIKYSVLSLTLLLRGTLSIPTFYDSDIVASRVWNVCGLDAKYVPAISEAAKSLSHAGAFLKYNEQTEAYVFEHDTIHEAVFSSFINRFARETLKYSSIELISRACTLKSNLTDAHGTKHKDKLGGSSKIAVNANHMSILIDRFISVAQSRSNKDYANMTKSKLWLDPRFQENMVQVLHFSGLVLVKDSKGESLLVHAVRAGILPCIRTLLSAMQTSYTYAPQDILKEKDLALQTACKYQDISVIAALVEVVPYISVDVMFEAASSGNVNVMEYLIVNDGNILCQKNGVKLLHHACQKGKLELVKFLVRKIKELSDNEIDEYDILSSSDNKYGNQTLHFAAISGNVDLVRYILDCGVQPTIINVLHNASVLHFTCQHGHVELVKLLLNRAPELLNATDLAGVTPLLCAAFKGHLQVLKHLILQGADVKDKVNEGWNLIHVCCMQGRSENIEMLKFLTSKFPWMIEEVDGEGKTPFHTAVKSGNIELLKCFVDSGCKPTVTNIGGKNLIHVCVQGRIENIEMLRFLISEFPQMVHEKDGNGLTPIHIAARSGSVEFIKCLLDCGVQLAVKDASHNANVLHFSCQHGHVELVKFLLQKAPELLHKTDLVGATPLLCAAFKGHLEVLKYLILQGADVKDRIKNGRNLIHVCCILGGSENIEMLQYLIIKFPWMMEEVDGDGMTPLHIAVKSGSINLLTCILDAGFESTVTSIEGLNLIHLSCFQGKTENIEMLRFLILKFPWMMEEVDVDGKTPLHTAVKSGNFDLLKCILNSGVKPTVTSVKCRNLIHVCCFQGSTGNIEMLRYLISKFPQMVDEKDLTGFTPIHIAARCGNVDFVECILDSGVQPTIKSFPHSATVCHVACQRGHLELVQFLLNRAPELLSATDRKGATPLICSALKGHLGVLKYLILQGADVEEKTVNKQNLIHVCCTQGRKENIELLRFLISKFPQMLDEKDGDGLTPLQSAANSGNVEFVKYILDRGANPTTNYVPQTVIEFACLNGQLELVKFLLNRTPSLLQDTADGVAPLLNCAALEGHLDILKYLIVQGADVRAKTTDGHNLIHTCCTQGRSENIKMLEYLLSEFPWMMDEVDVHGLTPLHTATRCGNVDLLARILDSGVQPIVSSIKGSNLIHVCCLGNTSKNIKMLRYLISKFPKMVDEMDGNGLTPLHIAANSGNADFVKCILDSDVHTDFKSVYHYATVIHVPCVNGHLEVVQLLLNRAPDLLHGTNRYGNTPLISAALKGHLQVLQYLIRQGADVTTKSKDGYNLIHICCIEGRTENIEMLQYLVSQYPWMVEEEDFSGRTPVYTAVASGAVELLKCLCVTGANIKHRTKDNKSVIHEACKVRNAHGILRYISLHYPAFYEKEEKNSFKELLTSVIKGDVIKFKQLIGQEFIINYRTLTGKSLLHIVIECKQNAIVEQIFARKTNVYDRIDRETYTKLHIAASNGDLSTIKDLFVKDEESIRLYTLTGRNVLHLASKGGHTEVVNYLLGQCCELLIERDLVQNTPLHDAVLSGSVEVVRCLISRGADIRARGCMGATPLHLASRNGPQALVEYLVTLSQDLMEEKDNQNWTSILVAAMNGKLQEMTYLAKAGADVRSTDTRNKSILHLACRKKRPVIVKYLVTTYPDLLDKEDDYGYTPIHEAAAAGDVAIVKTLVDAGVNCHCSNRLGETPLNIARRNNHAAIVNYLETCPTKTHSGDIATVESGSNCSEQMRD